MITIHGAEYVYAVEIKFVIERGYKPTMDLFFEIIECTIENCITGCLKVCFYDSDA
ncbi:hypothetical protein [Leptospira santarosai]|uniref:hypothetical protein n=1 Tax=Leptospira santarosai TaxID=28183 RepID=UPI0018FEC149